MNVGVYSQACNTEVNCDVYHRLSRLGIVTEVYVPVFRHKRGMLMKLYGKVKIWECRTLLSSHPRLQMPVRFLKECALGKVDVAYIEAEVISFVVCMTWALSRIRGFKVVVQTYENMAWNEKFEWMKYRFPKRALQGVYRGILRLIAALPDHIITVSIDSYGVFKRVSRNTSLVALGVNKAQFRKLQIDQLATLFKHQRVSQRADSMLSVRDISENTFKIGYAGRICAQKGIFKTLELFKQADINSVLIIDWPENDDSKECREVGRLIAKYKLEDRICLVSFSHSNMQLYYNSIDAVICLSEDSKSWKEQYGRIPVEAAMCGLSPVMSDSGHFKHLPIAKMNYEEWNSLFLQQCRSSVGYFSSCLTTEAMAKELSLIIYSLFV